MPKNSFNNEAGYNGNINLPRADSEISLTEAELKEYVRCATDVYYFINNYVKIVHVDHGIVPFSMWPFQEKIVQAFENNRFVICKLARQSGKSTVVVCGYFLWYVLFHPDVSVGILANKESTAIELLRRLKQSYELLPRFMKQGIIKWDAKLIMLANNSRVRAESTSASAIRGDTFNILFLDEFAFVPENIATDFMTSVFPTISSGKTTKLFIVSTPNGYNLFYKIWNDAEQRRNSYVPVGFTWRDVPGRDDVWAEEMRKNLGSEQAWEQEFECSFQGSANTLISAKKLAQMVYHPPIEDRGPLKIYAHPIRATLEHPSHIYVGTLDVSQGQEQDYSVLNIFDVSVSPFRQVAVYRQNNIAPQLFAPIVRDICEHYCNAFVLAEINDVGIVVADMLHTELEYENLMFVRAHPKKGQMLGGGGFHPKSRLGLRMTQATKRVGCSGLRAMIEKDQLLLCDFETIRELTTFVANGQNWQAETGNHDDIVMTLVVLGWLTGQQGFENYVGLSMRKMLMNQYEPVTLDEPFAGFFDINAARETVVADGATWSADEDVKSDRNDFWLK